MGSDHKEMGEMRNTLQRPPTRGATDDLEVRGQAEFETVEHPRRPANTALIVAAIVGFVLATVTVTVLLSGDGTVSDEATEPTIAQRDLTPALRPSQTDLIVLDTAGLDLLQPGGLEDKSASCGWGTWELEPAGAPLESTPDARPHETDAIVLDMAGLGKAAAGGEDPGSIHRPREVDRSIPQ
jgi:hypothetical protein